MKDMTKGKPLKLILLFSIPLFISGLIQNLYNFCDTIMVGRMVGIEALAAIGATLPMFFLLVVIGAFFSLGLSLIASQLFGKKDYNKMRASIAMSCMLSLIIGGLYNLLFAVTLRWGLRLSNVPESVFELTYSYLIVLCGGGVIILFFNLFISFLRAIGNSKGPLYFLILSSVLNVLFNYIFIKYCKMGIVGSAYGTIVALLISTVFCLVYIYRKYPILIPNRDDWRFSFGFAKKHLRIAIPMASQGVFVAVSLFIFQIGCNKLGPEVMAAVAAANRIENIATVALLSLGMGIATYVAQNYGAGRIARIRKGVMQTSLFSFVVSFVMGLLVYVFCDELISLFITKKDLALMPNAAKLAKQYLNVIIIYFLFLGHIFIYRNTLQSLNNTKMPVLSTFAELVARIFAIFYLANFLEYKAITYAQPLAWLAGAFVLYVGYYFEIKKLRDKVKQRLINKIGIKKF